MAVGRVILIERVVLVVLLTIWIIIIAIQTVGVTMAGPFLLLGVSLKPLGVSFWLVIERV